VHTSILTTRPCHLAQFIPMRWAWKIAAPCEVQPSRAGFRMAVVALCVLPVVAWGPWKAGGTSVDARPHTLTVEARDLLTDAPVPGVSLTLNLPDGVKQQATTGADGNARFEFSLPEATNRRFFAVRARSEGSVPLGARWGYTLASPTPPDRIRLQIEKATTISGRVLDQDGQPVADSVVVLSVKKTYPRSQQWIDLSFEPIRTDAKGRWSFGNVPQQPDSIDLCAYSYLCLAEQSCFFPEPFQPVSALRDGSAVLRLFRGTLFEGRVLSPDGHPVADAEVGYGEGRGYGNAIPPLKTDANGKFTLGIKPGTPAILVARASRFGPTVRRVRVGGGPLRVDLTLERPHSFRGRVVDPKGKPIARAQVSAYWSGSDGSPGSFFEAALGHRLTTDDDGRFDWKEAPGSGVHANVSAVGFVGKGNLALASDVDHDIVLAPPTAVKGTVVDRATGQPVPVFSLTPATESQPGSPLIWQRGSDVQKNARKAPGSFEFTTFAQEHRCLVRVQAEGYLPEDSELFPLDGTAHALTFRLSRAEPIRGTVRNPDGSLARDGFVYLVPSHREGWIDYLSLNNDTIDDNQRGGTVHAKIGADGRFSLPPQKENFALLALSDAGSRLVPRRELHGDDVLSLQPWARIAGTMTLDGKPAANLHLQSYDVEESAPVEGEPRLVRDHYLKTGADGSFELPRVLPGRLTLVQWVPNGVERRMWAVVRLCLDVESGRSYDLKIGTSGRLATGRLVLPRADVWMIRKAEIVPRDATTGRPVPIGVELLEGGRFRALDLKPGEYTLRIALHEPPPANSCGWGRLLSEYVREFTVPPQTSASDAYLDLGVLEPTTAPGLPLQVGDRAPDFSMKTLAGQELKLADFRSKYVLLDFWASWCAPCLAEMPNLLAIKNQFAQDQRFVVIGVSLDDRPANAAASVKALKLSWLQGFAGPDSPVVSAYGATAIPATFLIGPDGKILARDLRGDQTKRAVAEALKH
jgi:peroxiredoxin/protocatechuate 3,4-dioxygenase beta subunit